MEAAHYSAILSQPRQLHRLAQPPGPVAGRSGGGGWPLPTRGDPFLEMPQPAPSPRPAVPPGGADGSATDGKDDARLIGGTVLPPDVVREGGVTKSFAERRLEPEHRVRGSEHTPANHARAERD